MVFGTLIAPLMRYLCAGAHTDRGNMMQKSERSIFVAYVRKLEELCEDNIVIASARVQLREAQREFREAKRSFRMQSDKQTHCEGGE